jgi:hypothetical protein
MNNNTARLALVSTEISSTGEEDTAVDLQLERIALVGIDKYVFYRGTREAFAANYATVLAEHSPELVARFPTINVAEETYGFIAGTVIVTTRALKPYYWVGLPKAAHWYIEQLIREEGTREEAQRVANFRRGFITNSGRVVSRFHARTIANDAKQILPKRAHRLELYSDDIYA